MKVATSQKPTITETKSYNLRLLERRAQDLCRQAENDIAKTVIIAGYLRSNTFYDARTPFSSAKGLDPVEAFIFETRKGWCVHYATATALMLRAAGVPTRFITGFMITGNVGCRAFNILDRYGHAWCEALVQTADGPRWIVVDPSTRPQSPPAACLKKLKMFIGVGLIAAILLLLVRTRMRVSVKDLKREIEEEKANTEAEHIAAVYNRILRYFERMGLYRAKFQTPREFIRMVPASQQNDVKIITRAFECAKYMGWTTFGGVLSEVDNAQARILGLKRGKRGRAK